MCVCVCKRWTERVAYTVYSRESPSENHLAQSNAHQLLHALSRLQSRGRSLTPLVGQYDKLHIIHKSISYTVVSLREIELLSTVTVGQLEKTNGCASVGKGKQASSCREVINIQKECWFNFLLPKRSRDPLWILSRQTYADLHDKLSGSQRSNRSAYIILFISAL